MISDAPYDRPEFGGGMYDEPEVFGTISLEAVGQLQSGDYGGKMADTLRHMCCDRRYNNQGDYLPCHEYILRIAIDMEENGWTGPPLLIVDRDEFGEGPTVENGHHRYNAAVLAGLTEAPYTDKWGVSEGSGDQSW